MAENGLGDRESAPQDDSVVRGEVERVRAFVGDLSMDDLRQGDWFAKLLTFSLGEYHKKVDADYFRAKYPDLPADAVVDARIQLATRYASIEGGLTAAAYTGAVAATIGTGGGASPLTLPAGGASFVVDMVFLSQLQLRLAHDIAVLYRVPLNLEDPEDLWKLIRIAFVIKSGELGGNAVLKGVPAVVRPMVKKVFTKGTLHAVKSLPVVGKYLLQRNIIKFAIPGVGIPLTMGVNFWTTKVAGAHAKRTFRAEARIVEVAKRMTSQTEHPAELIWVLWMMVAADGGGGSTRQRTLLHQVMTQVRRLGHAHSDLDELRDLIEVDEARVWGMLAAAEGDLDPVYRAAVTAVVVDGKVRASELQRLERLAEHCSVEHNPEAVREVAKSWA